MFKEVSFVYTMLSTPYVAGETTEELQKLSRIKKHIINLEENQYSLNKWMEYQTATVNNDLEIIKIEIQELKKSMSKLQDQLVILSKVKRIVFMQC